MPDEYNSPSENWNVAKGYSGCKILNPLIKADSLYLIAKYGSEDIDNAIELEMRYEDIYYKKRLQAIDMLHTYAILLINNSINFVKKDDKEELGKIKKSLKKLDLKNIKEDQTNQISRSKLTKVHEISFDLALEAIMGSLENITAILNQNHLIFPSSEEFDVDSMKDIIINEG